MSEELEFLKKEIFSRYGSIKRARGHFLYTQKGIRLTDLYLENGRAILGWGGSSSFTELKNVLSRGITGSFITDVDFRLEKAVSALIGDKRKLFVFSKMQEAMEAALNIAPDSTFVYKPWAPFGLNWKDSKALIIVPPLAWTPDIFILAVKEETQINNVILENTDKKCIKLSSPIAQGVCRSFYNLIKAIQEQSEKDWFIWDKKICKYWERRGPYLYIKKDIIKEKNYKDFVLHCLNNGVIINPMYNGESIVPVGADSGVIKI